MTKRFVAPLVLIGLVASACMGTAESTTSSAVLGPPSTHATSTTTVPGVQEREVTEVECDSTPTEVAIVCEAYDLIRTHYVDPIADGVLASAAVEGLGVLDGADSQEPLVCVLISEAFATSCSVAAVEADTSAEAAEAIVDGFAAFGLDANSTYFDERELELLAEEQQGQIEGIGALVSPEDETIEGDNKQCSVLSDTCRVTIVSVIPGAPAEGVGLAKGDVIVGVNGESVLGWSVDQLTATVRGPAGTDVIITVEREGTELDFRITRASVEVPIISTERFGDTGYVQLSLFTANAGERFQFAVAGLLSEGVERLVIDLRNNPGGLLDSAIEVASVFLDQGDVVKTQGPEDTIHYPVLGVSIVPKDMPVIVVVNEGSASASEVVSGVLQETGRVTVVGENTFGKNTVQRRFGLSNGGALKLTVARWLTPGGLDFGGVGITPDIAMVLDSDIEAEDLVAAVLAAG